MGVKMTAGAVVAVVGVIAVIGGVLYLRKKGSDVADALNPANPGNIVNSAVLDFGKYLTGDQNWTLGGSIYDSTHNSDGSYNWRVGVGSYNYDLGKLFTFDPESVNPTMSLFNNFGVKDDEVGSW